MSKITFLLLITTCFMSCKTISVNNDTQITTSQNMVLGSVGEDKQFILENDYNHTALPEYNAPLKVQLSIQQFKKSTYKQFTKSADRQNAKFAIAFVDSLRDKPQFLKLELSDRVELLNALNAKFNNDVKDYILNKKEAHIITSVSLALEKNKLNELVNADEVFLESTGIKSYALKLYKNGQVETTLDFNEGVVFAYQASNFCWQENDKYQLEIVDIVEGTDKCPNTTYRNAKRAKKEIDYFKF